MTVLTAALICTLLATAPFCSAAHLPIEVRQGTKKKTPTNSRTTTIQTKANVITSTTGGPSTPARSASSIPNVPTSTWTGSTLPPTTAAGSREADYDGCSYNIEGVGRFKNKKVFTFYNGLPEGLYASEYIVYDQYDGAPYNHAFQSKNVVSDGDFLNLIVPGETREASQIPNQAISSAEIVTTENKILYASVRTNAIFSQVPGTCHGTPSPCNHLEGMLIRGGREFLLLGRHPGNRH